MPRARNIMEYSALCFYKFPEMYDSRPRFTDVVRTVYYG